MLVLSALHKAGCSECMPGAGSLTLLSTVMFVAVCDMAGAAGGCIM